MTRLITFTAICALMGAPVQAQRVVHGVVFNDINGNGVLDQRERGVSGVVDSVQLAWLTRDVAAVPASTPIVMVMHIPLTSGVEALTGYINMALVSSVAHLPTGPTFRHTGANTLAVLNVFRGRAWPLILGGHTHVAEKIVYQTDRGPLRFEQSAAIVGPNDYGAVVMQSGFSVYTVTNGVIDAGTFVPLTMPDT